MRLDSQRDAANDRLAVSLANLNKDWLAPSFDGRWWRLKPNGARTYRWPAE